MTKKILICDDELGIRESLKLILSDKYELVITDSPAAALDVIDKRHDIGLVLLDIKMPKMNGLETLQEIKSKRPDLKTIIVTGYKSVETASEAASLGANGYIVKPFRAEEILATVEKNLK